MKEYVFTVTGGTSLHIIVKAESIDEAIEKAKDSEIETIFCDDTDRRFEVWRTSGEIDCDPSSAELDAVRIDGRRIEGREVIYLQEKWSRE